MSATTIFFNGRVISRPGSYSEIDASGLATVGVGSSGIVAVLGTAIGGKPYTEVDTADVKGTLQVASRPETARQTFKFGSDLREGAEILFEPSDDPDVPGGAQEVVPVKVNPATKAQASFDNADGEALILKSSDWGNDANQTSVQIATGTTQGKLITITLEGVSEVFDDVGGDTIFTLQYLSGTPADGFTTITAEIDASRLKTLFTRAQTGLDGEVSNQVTAGQTMELLSDNAGDTAKIRIFGTDASDATQTEVVTLNGTTVVDTANVYNSFHGAEVIEGTLAGTLTIRNDSGGSTIATIAAAGTEAAVEFTTDHTVTGAISFVADAATTARVTVFGLSASGTYQTETVQLAGTTPVAGSATWSRIDGMALGELAAARTLTISGTSVDALFTSYPTLQKLADRFNAAAGYTFTIPATVTNASSYATTDLDHLAATSILSAASITATGNLAAIIAKLTAESQLVVPSKGSVASGAPDNTTGAVFLTGGHEGSSTPGQEGVPTATNTDWQNALDLLKKVRVNTVVVLTGDPAIHAMVKAHCEFMAGVGKSERDMVVGALNSGLTDVPTKTELKTQAANLNTRHARIVGQAIERFNTAGDRVEFLPQFSACVVAGMQAGSPVATSLTNKYANVLKVRQDSSWSPVDDGEELIQAGILMFEAIDGIGRRVVRNVTTHLSSSNIAFTEASVNEATNFSVFNFRTTMERMTGRTGFAGTVNAAKGLAVNALGLLVNVSLVAWRSLDIALILDVLEVSVEMAPLLPINFVKNTVHLVAVPQSAAA